MSENDILATKKQIRKTRENIRNDIISDNDCKKYSFLEEHSYFIMASMTNVINKKFKKNNFKTAESFYSQLELQSKQDGKTDVVLILLDKLKLLENASHFFQTEINKYKIHKSFDVQVKFY